MKNLIFRMVSSYSKDLEVAMNCGSIVCEKVTEEWAMQHFSHIAAGIEVGNYELVKLTDTCTIVRTIPRDEIFSITYTVLELVS